MAHFEDALIQLNGNNVDSAIGILKELWLVSKDPRAACKLGDIFHKEIFHKGRGGVVKNDILAAKWYFVAAKMQSGEAQYMLGEFFKNGWGVPQNLCQAHKYYNLAAMNGYDGALRKRDTLANLISPERVAQAQDLAWDFAKGLYGKTPTIHDS